MRIDIEKSAKLRIQRGEYDCFISVYFCTDKECLYFSLDLNRPVSKVGGPACVMLKYVTYNSVYLNRPVIKVSGPVCVTLKCITCLVANRSDKIQCAECSCECGEQNV